MTPRVKICGLTTTTDVDAATSAGADALGFVVDTPVDTPREIAPSHAATLVDRVPPFVTTVLVTMADTPGDVTALTDLIGVDAVQLHGDLTTDVGAVKAATGLPTIAAVDATATPTDTAAEADAILLDSTDDAGAGGTGTTHEWDRTATHAATSDVPVILAGGLTPDNVGDAVRTVDPYAVDVATGVERTGGHKDHDAVQAFIDTATGTQP